MVKKNKHSVVFDENERNSFLKKFVGAKGAKNKKVKKVKKRPQQTPKNRLKVPYESQEDPVETNFCETKYEDVDGVNKVSVEVTTKVRKF